MLIMFDNGVLLRGDGPLFHLAAKWLDDKECCSLSINMFHDGDFLDVFLMETQRLFQ